MGALLLGTVAVTESVGAVGLPIPPDPPTGLTSTALAGGATLQWTAPLVSGDSAVTDYTVSIWSASTGGTLVTQCSAVAPAETCDVSSLANGVEYFADVVATSVAGSSVASAPRVRTVAIWALTPTPKPLITGVAAKSGVRLGVTVGVWGPAPVSLAVQWLRSGVNIPGATGLTYLPNAADVGHRMSVRVTGSKPGFDPVSQTSNPTGFVAGLNLTAAPNPLIGGVPKYGQRLTARPGTWGPSPVTLRYVWLRNGLVITGATASSYVLSPSDVGKRISVRVTGSKTGYAPAVRTSPATATVAPLLLTATPTPLISGTPKVGSRLSARPGTWGPSPVTLTYTWFKNGVAIKGATQSSYVIAPNDAGAKINVKVIGARPGFQSIARYSAVSATITIAIRIASDATRVVGTQVLSGTYVTVSKTLTGCYWERVSGFGGTLDEILANNFGTGQQIVTVLPTDRGLTTSRCGAWYKLADIPVSQKTSIAGAGIWSVAKQIKPGTYRANGTGSCYWARLSGFTGDLYDIITNDFTYSRGSIVTISASDAGLESSAGCGTWTKVG